MTHWQRLGLSPDSDSAAIKRAYAALLKKHRPDEDPQGFASLHAAYKAALAEAGSSRQTPSPPRQKEVNNDQLVSDIDNQTTQDKKENEPVSAVEPPPNLSDFDQSYSSRNETQNEVEPDFSAQNIDNKSDVQNEIYQQYWNSLCEHAEMAMTDHESVADLSCWHFLEDHDGMYDLHIRPQFSYYLFDRWQQFLEQVDKLPHDFIPVLNYIIDIMHWQDQRREFEDEYGYERVSLMLDLDKPDPLAALPWKWLVPKQHQGPIEIASIFRRRLWAAALDAGLLIMVANFLPVEPYLKPLCAMMIHAIFHASPLQGTPGKILYGIKVTTLSGHRLNIFHSIWRTLMLLINLLGIKLTALLNVLIPGQKLLHDVLSKTLVIRR